MAVLGVSFPCYHVHLTSTGILYDRVWGRGQGTERGRKGIKEDVKSVRDMSVERVKTLP